jgi:hypothetical protein
MRIKLDYSVSKAASVMFLKTMQLILGFILFSSFAEGGGVAAVKEQSFHSDASAKPIVFVEMIDKGAPFVIFRIKGREVIVNKVNIAACLNLPNAIPAQILDENTIVPLRNSLMEINQFVERFPQIQPLLVNNREKLTEAIEKYDSGKIRIDGEWIARSEHQNIIQAPVTPAPAENANLFIEANGKKMKVKSIKVFDFDQGIVSILHEEGIQKIPARKLSNELLSLLPSESPREKLFVENAKKYMGMGDDEYEQLLANQKAEIEQREAQETARIEAENRAKIDALMEKIEKGARQRYSQIQQDVALNVCPKLNSGVDVTAYLYFFKPKNGVPQGELAKKWVMNLFGRPSTSDYEDFTGGRFLKWTYWNILKNPDTGKFEEDVSFMFNDSGIFYRITGPDENAGGDTNKFGVSSVTFVNLNLSLDAFEAGILRLVR